MTTTTDLATLEFAGEVVTHAATTRRRHLPSPSDVVLWVLVAIVLVVTLFPFYWSLRTAFSTTTPCRATRGACCPPTSRGVASNAPWTGVARGGDRRRWVGRRHQLPARPAATP